VDVEKYVGRLLTIAAGAVSTEATAGTAKGRPLASSIASAPTSTYQCVSILFVANIGGVCYQFLQTLILGATRGYMRVTYQALAHPPSRRPMILALRSVSRLRPRGKCAVAYFGLRGSLPGTSSAVVPSSWALQIRPLAVVPSFASQYRAGQKSRLASDACNLRTEGHIPIIAVGQTTRVCFWRAVYSVHGERVLLSVWVFRGCGVVSLIRVWGEFFFPERKS
jgi:hypothetical protein